ncbi:hypothetical protein CEY16_11100 [Halalkalibacillus sediminis]|uniref:Uncharacterized protein n=1 Tax=Halalkalibacillus sediminis TaxID=2018042 RepID=A0A2I0QSG1_9BACI|nr:hypothetical protein [Halalkalibacillus sediminis]PKR77277.1 hypothetical protein CEY16_11100 [Halalkalibacillus sediminis]
MFNNFKTKYQSVEHAGEELLKLVSQFIEVNSFCIANWENNESHIMKAFNRKELMVQEGITQARLDMY